MCDEIRDSEEYEPVPGLSSAESAKHERLVMRLRGQLQNCVNHLELLKRHGSRADEEKINTCIDSANKALYETLRA